MNLGFEIAHLSLDDALSRIGVLQDAAILPVDEDGVVIEDDSGAQESAREIRLLLQRVLDLDTRAFLGKMRELFFHLFSVDHSHYHDLLLQSARRDPVGTRDFCLEFILSEDVLFIDDQENLHDLYDVLEFLGLGQLPLEARHELRSLIKEPFFRLPSLHARNLQLLAPLWSMTDFADVKRLFEMDLVTTPDLIWARVSPTFSSGGTAQLSQPAPRPQQDLHRVQPDDFEWMRWALGIEGTPLGLALRLLGCLVAEGPDAFALFFKVSEAQPETAFEMRNFETSGQRLFFLKALDLLREDILRDVHHSAQWFAEIPEDRPAPWQVPIPPSAWPTPLRLLPAHWGEFANPTDGVDLGAAAREQILAIDRICDELSETVRKMPFPSTEQLDRAHQGFLEFQQRWNLLLQKIRPRLAVLP
ncbi:MAG: hypothetical protein KF865_12175 [Bdellovibrionaceae bacterium]|nr:hypothetical protein [Pseudobdellovibrionaceae bacterium]